VRKAWLTGATFALLSTSAAAQSTQQPPPGHHAMHLIKLPNGDYTVPLSALQGSGTSGIVILHPEGLKTIFTIRVSGLANRRHAFSLHSGSDCSLLGTPRNIALAPARTGQPSRTIVSLPITDLTSHDYSVTAQDATSRKQFEEACARL
jgi:Cu/Zn superoxide dismutase